MGVYRGLYRVYGLGSKVRKVGLVRGLYRVYGIGSKFLEGGYSWDYMGRFIGALK